MLLAGVLSNSEANLVSDLVGKFLLPNLARLDSIVDKIVPEKLNSEIENAVAQDVAFLNQTLTLNDIPKMEDQIVKLILIRIKLLNDIFKQFHPH